MPTKEQVAHDLAIVYIEKNETIDLNPIAFANVYRHAYKVILAELQRP